MEQREPDEEGDHPALLTERGKFAVTWWTYEIGGLRHYEFVTAAKADEPFGR